jgi:hypothetical protein
MEKSTSGWVYRKKLVYNEGSNINLTGVNIWIRLMPRLGRRKHQKDR